MSSVVVLQSVPLIDHVLSTGPDLIPGNFDSVLRSDYASASEIHTERMLFGLDVRASTYR